MVPLSLYSLFYLLGSLKRRVQIVEIVHGSIVTIQTLYSLFYLLGVLKHRVDSRDSSAVTIQALHSDVILHVHDGVSGIILGNIHTDHWNFKHLVPENDCIICVNSSTMVLTFQNKQDSESWCLI